MPAATTEPDRAARTRALLAGLDALPALPPVARRLMELGDLERADLAEVAGLIEMDPALTAGVLSMCRSACTGLGDRIATVRHAVTMLGVECIRRLVLAAAVVETLRDGAAGADERLGAGVERVFDREGYWVHCVAVACGAERLALDTGASRSDRAFMAGLLHGLGRQALEVVAPRAMDRVCELAAATGTAASQAERRALGIDHVEAGARLAGRWGLPGDVVAAIRGDGSGEHADLVRVVGAARWSCRRCFLGWSGEWDEIGPLESWADLIGGEAGADELAAETVRVLGARLADLRLGPGAWRGEAGLAVLIAREARRVLGSGARVREPSPNGRKNDPA